MTGLTSLYQGEIIRLPDNLRRNPWDDNTMFYLAAVCLSGPTDIPWEEILRWKMEVIYRSVTRSYGTEWVIKVLVDIHNDPKKPYVVCIYLGMNTAFDACFPQRFEGFMPNDQRNVCFFTMTGNLSRDEESKLNNNYVMLVDWSARKFPIEYLS
jgi:hypothetical protein